MRKAERAAKPKIKKVAQIEPAWEEPAQPVIEFCGNCHFWRGQICKRYPPEKREGQALATHRATIAADDWCGEWRHA